MGVDPNASRKERVARLLEDNVRSQLFAHNDGWNLGLSDDAIRSLASGVAVEILYAFDVDWAPDWVGSGDVHVWAASGGYFARCSGCLCDSPPCSSREEASAWAHAHEASHRD